MTHRLVVNRRSGEPYEVYVGRPTKWGNPFRIGQHGTRAEVLAMYRAWVLGESGLVGHLHELTGKRLACWCAPLPCHADILAELANP